jgi:hypothetical protein
MLARKPSTRRLFIHQAAGFLRWPSLGWPWSALVAWCACWGFDALLRWAGAGLLLALLGAFVLGVGLSRLNQGWFRQAIVAAGFPLSWVLHRGVGVLPELWAQAQVGVIPAWGWLLPLGLLLVLYPKRAWGDAPLFPTPAGGLQGLPDGVKLPPHARILDAGCGMGAGLRELSRIWPEHPLTGWEYSPVWAFFCRLRCPWARIQQRDIWAHSWADFSLVYLFQRPESMARAYAKAVQDMQPGTWLVSLEFPVPDVLPHTCLTGVKGRSVWVYELKNAVAQQAAVGERGESASHGVAAGLE